MQGARRSVALCVLVLVGVGALPAHAQAPVPTRNKPVFVEASAIKRGVLRHWQRSFAFALGDRKGWMHAEHRMVATAYLIEQRWIAGEARELGVTVSKDEIAHARAKLIRSQFRSLEEYAAHLRRTRLREADVVAAVRSELLAQRITTLVVEGAADVHEAQRRLIEYRAARRAKWQPRTTCAPSWKLPEWCA